MKNIVLLGAPGSGKGTLAAQLGPKQNLRHLSTGDLLREVVASGSELGKELNSYMSKGELVPDELITRMIKEKISSSNGGVLLDGFPRTVNQAVMLEKMFSELNRQLDKVFYLMVDLDTIIKRLSGRISCRICGKPFHLINYPPKKRGICDYCGGELIQREDDQEATIRNRYNTYVQKTQPLIDYYKEKGLLQEVETTKGAEKTLQDVLKFFGE